MIASDLYLMAFGPVLALIAGLFIYLSATVGRSNRVEKVLGVDGRTGIASGQRKP